MQAQSSSSSSTWDLMFSSSESLSKRTLDACLFLSRAGFFISIYVKGFGGSQPTHFTRFNCLNSFFHWYMVPGLPVRLPNVISRHLLTCVLKDKKKQITVNQQKQTTDKMTYLCHLVHIKGMSFCPPMRLNIFNSVFSNNNKRIEIKCHSLIGYIILKQIKATKSVDLKKNLPKT